MTAAKKHSVAHSVVSPLRKFSEVVIDGVTYRLAFSFGTIALVELQTPGLNLLQGLETLVNLNASTLLALFWASLLTFQDSITREMAGELIRLDTLRPISEAIAHAYNLSMPEQKKTEETVSEVK
jgi:hypothetical protein